MPLVVNEPCWMHNGKPVRNCRSRLTVNPAKPKAGDIDAVELGKLLGIDVDPGTDPPGFMRALLAKIDELRAKLTIGGDAAEPMTDPGDDMEEEPVMNYHPAAYTLTEQERRDVLDLDARRQEILNRPPAKRSKDEPIVSMFERLQPWEK